MKQMFADEYKQNKDALDQAEAAFRERTFT